MFNILFNDIDLIDEFKIALKYMFPFITIDLESTGCLYVDEINKMVYKKLNSSAYVYVINQIDIIESYNILKLLNEHSYVIDIKTDEEYKNIDKLLSDFNYIIFNKYFKNFYDEFNEYNKLYYIVINNQIHTTNTENYNLFFKKLKTVSYNQFIRANKLKQLL